MVALKEVQAIEEARQQTKEADKRKARQEYGIGWRVDCAPSNMGLASKLDLKFLSNHGLCSLAFDEEAHRVRIVEGTEPAAWVNLEYLSLALQVRLHAGREPSFSLDPDDRNKEGWMQTKRFQPEWLMGTSLGEVMFQADYHLKELAVGEYEQPVVGMKSAFDFVDAEGIWEKWNARAWYVVNDADVLKTENDVLIPRVKMGVEAREQVAGEHGTTDVPVTRPDHPLVKYAELFTHYFDLIAERKSVVHHLHEAARASVLAKFLLEAQVHLDDTWFDLVDWPGVKEAAAECCLEIPQLWKDRTRSEVRLRDGELVGAKKGLEANTVSLYGGVEFGLGRFALPPGRRAAPEMLAPSAGLMARTFAPARAPPLRVGLAARAMAPAARPFAPQGVDLNLDRFDLSAATRTEACAAPGAAMSIDAFWSLIDGCDSTAEGDMDVTLLRKVFNPHLSDRRTDGDRFACPDLSESHLQQLRLLVDEESGVRQRRKEHFFSEDFAPGEPGPLFPSSWAFALEACCTLEARKQPCPRTKVALEDLKPASVVFDKSTEDGLRFRTYKHRGFEVRTTQEHGGTEVVGAVFFLVGCQREGGSGPLVRGGMKGGEQSMRVTVASVAASAVASEGPPAERKVAPTSERKSRLAKLIHSSGALKKDREVVLAAVEQHGLSLQHAAEELKADREVVGAAIQDDGGALEFASEHLRADRDVVLAAVGQDGCSLEHASDELRGEPCIAMAALQSNSFALKSVAPSLRANRDLILSAVQRNALALEHASDELLTDRSFLLAAVRRNAMVMEDVPRELRADRDFMLEVVRGNGFALKFASGGLRADKELVSAALEQDGRAAEYADKATLEDCLRGRGR